MKYVCRYLTNLYIRRQANYYIYILYSIHRGRWAKSASQHIQIVCFKPHYNVVIKASKTQRRFRSFDSGYIYNFISNRSFTEKYFVPMAFLEIQFNNFAT